MEENNKRKKLLVFTVCCFVLIGVLVFLYWLEVLRFEEYTNDAYVNGNLVELILMMTAEQPTRFQMAQMIREDWSKLGIKVHLLSLEFNTLVTKLTVTKDWEIALIGLTGSPDPHFGANVWLSGGNLHFWNLNPKNPSAWELEIDELFRKAATTLDKTERQKYYKEWQKLASEELPLIYTVLPEVIYAVRNRFGKLKPTVLGGPFYPIEKVKTE